MARRYDDDGRVRPGAGERNRIGAIGAGASDAVALLVVDPPHGELGVQRVPGRALVGMNQGSLRDPLTNGRHSSLFSREHLRQRAAFTLAHHHNDLAFTGLVLGEPAVDPAGSQVLRPDMAAEAGAVDLSRSSLATDAQRFRAGRNGLAQLVRQHKRGLDWTSRSRARASMLLPLTSLQKAATASR